MVQQNYYLTLFNKLAILKMRHNFIGFFFLTVVFCNAQEDIVKQAWQDEKQKRFEDAYTKFIRAVEKYPDTSMAWKGKADMELLLYNDTDQALVDYGRAIELKPKAVWAFFAQGKIKLNRKEYNEALDDFNTALNIKPDIAIAYGYRATCKSKLGDHNGAINDYTEEINNDPYNYINYYNRANEYCWIKKYDTAIADCKKALQLKPGAKEVQSLIDRAKKAKENSTGYTEQNPIIAYSPKKVYVGQYFGVNYYYDELLTHFKAPSFDDFVVYTGPDKFNPNKLFSDAPKSSVGISYQLIAIKKGNYTIAPAYALKGADTLESNSLQIEVDTGKQPEEISYTYYSKDKLTVDSASFEHPLELNDSEKQNMFVQVIVDKKKVFKGEEIVVYLKTYCRFMFDSLLYNKTPSISYSENAVIRKYGNRIIREVVNNKYYKTTLTAYKTIYPSQSGTLELGPFMLNCVLKIPFTNSGNTYYKKVMFKLLTDKTSIEVEPLPPATKHFSGITGYFSVKNSFNHLTVFPGDTVHYTITLTGKGNLSSLTSIPFKFPPGLKHGPPILTDHVFQIADSTVNFNHIINYPLTSTTESTFIIPDTSILIFDPSEMSYLTRIIPGVTLNFAKPTPIFYTCSDSLFNYTLAIDSQEAFHNSVDLKALNQIQASKHADTVSAVNYLYRIESISITRKSDGKLLQTIIPPANSCKYTVSKKLLLVSEDINYDGYPDLRLIRSFTYASPLIHYSFWTYNPAVQKFEYDKTLDTISSPEFDPLHKEITSRWKSGKTRGANTYSYTDDKLTLIRQETEHVNPDNPQQEIITKKELIDGEMKVMETYTVNRDKY